MLKKLLFNNKFCSFAIRSLESKSVSFYSNYDQDDGGASLKCNPELIRILSNPINWRPWKTNLLKTIYSLLWRTSYQHLPHQSKNHTCRRGLSIEFKSDHRGHTLQREILSLFIRLAVFSSNLYRYSRTWTIRFLPNISKCADIFNFETFQTNLNWQQKKNFALNPNSVGELLSIDTNNFLKAEFEISILKSNFWSVLWEFQRV